MDILITGGSGFMGRNLADYLAKGHRVFAPTHKELELLDEKVVRDYFKDRTFDVAIHSAVRPGHRDAKDRSRQCFMNLRMFHNIIRNNGHFGKMIFLSSGAVYDVSKPLAKVREDDFDINVPSDEHGFSKYVIAKEIEHLDNIIELRIFGIFGKYENYAIRFISNAICKTIFDLPITIKQNRKMDYLFIDDLMPVIDYFLGNQGNHKVYNITPDRAIELVSLAEKVKIISGKKLPIVIRDKIMGIEYSGDNSRLKDEIGTLRLTPVDLAIEKLYDWYRENKILLNKDLLLTDK